MPGITDYIMQGFQLGLGIGQMKDAKYQDRMASEQADEDEAKRLEQEKLMSEALITMLGGTKPGETTTETLGYDVATSPDHPNPMSTIPEYADQYEPEELTPITQTTQGEAQPMVSEDYQALLRSLVEQGVPWGNVYNMSMLAQGQGAFDQPEPEEPDTYSEEQANLIAQLTRGPSGEDASMFTPNDVTKMLESMGADPKDYASEMDMLFNQRPDILNDMVFPPEVPQEVIYRDMGAGTGVLDPYGNLLNMYPDIPSPGSMSRSSGSGSRYSGGGGSGSRSATPPEFDSGYGPQVWDGETQKYYHQNLETGEWEPLIGISDNEGSGQSTDIYEAVQYYRPMLSEGEGKAVEIYDEIKGLYESEGLTRDDAVAIITELGLGALLDF